MQVFKTKMLSERYSDSGVRKSVFWACVETTGAGNVEGGTHALERVSRVEKVLSIHLEKQALVWVLSICLQTRASRNQFIGAGCFHGSILALDFSKSFLTSTL